MQKGLGECGLGFFNFQVLPRAVPSLRKFVAFCYPGPRSR